MDILAPPSLGALDLLALGEQEWARLASVLDRGAWKSMDTTMAWSERPHGRVGNIRTTPPGHILHISFVFLDIVGSLQYKSVDP